uniref:Kit ligand n=1 Tax=Oncorhynchus tshawytscha TaxID=74940 RepID=A0AAZ3SJK5_ONCTS
MCFLCQIRTTTCVLLFLFTSLGVCSGGFGNPVTDDVSRLMLLVRYSILNSTIGVCWVLLNIYPLEQSLRELAQVFGAISSNKDNIMIFITMLQNLRFKFDHEELEATMQVFKCHYRAVKWPSGQYFDYIRDILNSAAQGEGGFRCVPPPCPAPTTPAPTYSIHKSLPHRVLFSLSGSEAQDHEQTRSRGSLLSLLPIPVTACVFLIVWAVMSGPEHLQGMLTLVPAQHYYYTPKSKFQLIIKCVSTWPEQKPAHWLSRTEEHWCMVLNDLT